MIDQSTIQYISALLNQPGGQGIADNDRTRSLAQSYPYFPIVHYLLAKDQYAVEQYSPALLSASRPYIENWLLFCDFINGRASIAEPIASIAEQVIEKPQIHVEQEAIVASNVVEEEAFVVPAIEAQSELKTEPVPDEQHIGAATELISDDSAEVISEIQTEQLIVPVYTEDYFLHQGIKVSEEMPDEIEELKDKEAEEREKSLMVMMSFSEWLLHFKSTSQKQKEEQDDQKALKTMWQKEKLAAAIEEENEEIPEEVFEMAVNSIAKEEDLASESLADIYIKQGKYDKAIEMYRKLSLRNPQKNTYFARKIEEVLKEKQS